MTAEKLAELRRLAEEAKQVRNLSELAEYAERGTQHLSGFGWARLQRLLVDLLPFIAAANPLTVIELLDEKLALLDRIAELERR